MNILKNIDERLFMCDIVGFFNSISVLLPIISTIIILITAIYALSELIEFRKTRNMNVLLNVYKDFHSTTASKDRDVVY